MSYLCDPSDLPQTSDCLACHTDDVSDDHPLANPGGGQQLNLTLTNHPDTANQGGSTGETVGPEVLSSAWRHSGWANRRAKVYQAMQDVGLPPKRLERYAMCGSNAWVVQDRARPDRLRVAASYCRDRWCQPCGQARAIIAAGNLRRLIKDQPHRFITLTIKADDRSLAARLQHLYDSFRRLRRSRTWSDRITGGVACTEVVWSTWSRAWHVHMHVIAEGRYLPQRELSAAWLQATGDSYVVDIRLIRGQDEAVNYVTKYATKPLTADTIADAERLREAIHALQGRRLLLTWGTWHRCRLTEVSDDTEWIPLAPLASIIRDAETGDAWSRSIIVLLRRLRSCQTSPSPSLPDP